MLTYDALERIAGLSRPLTMAGKKLLCDAGFLRITYDESGRIRYKLNGARC